MDYTTLFSDYNKFEEQLLKFIELYYNEINKNNKEILFSNPIKKDDIIWKNKIKLFLENFQKNLNPKNTYNKSRISKILDTLEEKSHSNSKIINNEFNLILDISELLFEIHFERYGHPKKSGIQLNKNMTRNIYKELIHIIKLLINRNKSNKKTSYEFILRFYEDQYYLIKYMTPNFTNIEYNDYINKELKIKMLIYLNKNLNSENSFELNPLKEEFIKYDLENNNYIEKDYDFYIKNKTKDVIKSMFEFVPFKLPNYNFININDDKNNNNKDLSNINEDEKDNISFDSDSEEPISNYSNNLSLSDKESE